MIECPICTVEKPDEEFIQCIDNGHQLCKSCVRSIRSSAQDYIDYAEYGAISTQAVCPFCRGVIPDVPDEQDESETEYGQNDNGIRDPRLIQEPLLTTLEGASFQTFDSYCGECQGTQVFLHATKSVFEEIWVGLDTSTLSCADCGVTPLFREGQARHEGEMTILVCPALHEPDNGSNGYHWICGFHALGYSDEYNPYG